MPGELLGYWEAHKKYGKLEWIELFKPSIALAEKGCLVNRYLANSLKGKESFIRNEPTLAEILINKETGEVYTVSIRNNIPIHTRRIR